MSKKNRRIVLLVSILLTVAFFILAYSDVFKVCRLDKVCDDRLNNLSEDLFIFLPVFIFSCIAHRMSNIAYKSWFRVASVWILMTVLWAVFSTKDYYTDMFLSVADIVFLSSIFFSVVSILLLLWVYIDEHRHVTKGNVSKNLFYITLFIYFVAYFLSLLLIGQPMLGLALLSLGYLPVMFVVSLFDFFCYKNRNNYFFLNIAFVMTVGLTVVLTFILGWRSFSMI